MFNLSESLIGNIIQILIVGAISFFYIRNLLKRDCKWAYIIAYVLRIILLLFSVYGRNIGYLPFDGADTEFFYSGAIERQKHDYYSKDALVTITAWASCMLGNSRLLYQYVMTMISMFGVRLTDLSMECLKIKHKIRYFCLYIIAVAPTFAMLNIIYSREAIVMTCIIGSFYLFIRYLEEENIKIKALLLLCAFAIDVAACVFHAVPITILIGYIIALFLYDSKNDRFRLTKKSLLLGVAFLSAIVMLYVFFPFVFEKISNIRDVKTIAGRFMYEKNLEAGSSYAQYVGDSDTWGRFIMFTPVRMFYAMFAPLPWEWRGLADIATFFGNSIFYLIVSATALVNVFRRNYWSNFNRWFVFTLLIVAATVGWGSVAFGTAIRHRDKFFPLFVILMALELRGRYKKID